MAEMDIGYVGDKRLKKQAPGFCNAFPIGKRSVCASSETIEPKR